VLDKTTAAKAQRKETGYFQSSMKSPASQSGPPVDSFQIFPITGERKNACPVDEESLNVQTPCGNGIFIISKGSERDPQCAPQTTHAEA